MARRKATSDIEHHWVSPTSRHFSYERPDLEHVPVPQQSEAEPRLGPYETRYPVQLGYSAPPRAVV